MMRMRRLASFVTIALLAASCSLLEVGNDTSTTVPSDTSPAASSESTGTAAETDPTTATTLSDCTAAQADIVLLCEAVDLMQRRYVDPITDDQLVSSALNALGELAQAAPSDRSSVELDCDVEDEVARPVCLAIDEADIEPLTGVETALMAMAFDLDPNSAYLDPEALALAQDDTSGQVEGIGALVNAEDPTADDPIEAQCQIISDTCQLVVVSTFQDSPAQRAGLLPGDVFVTVNGRPIAGLQIDEVTDQVRGPAGTEVAVGLDRDGELLEFDIVRASVDIPIAEWEMVGDVGYLRFNLFTVNADAQVREALRQLLSAGARGIVFDVRDNPGGALQAAVEVTSEFLAEGEVVRTESPDDSTSYEVTGDGVATDPSLPLWMVVNRGSASASELMAGVLGETGRAVVLGENTFGKNTVQQRFPLGNGGALKLTIARWVTPSGRDFGAVGIAPDIEADFPFEMSPAEVVERVLELVE
jgi:carboxyl-terminal processing protease